MSINEIKRLNFGYDLDGGGYSFEEGTDDLYGYYTLDSGLDYLPLPEDALTNEYGRPDTCGLFVFSPDACGSTDFPLNFKDKPDDPDSDVYVRISEGQFFGSDHECHCHCVIVDYTGAAGEGPELEGDDLFRYAAAGVEYKGEKPISLGGRYRLEHTGNTNDQAYPDCERCEGDGIVDSPGGAWAVYDLRGAEDWEWVESEEYDSALIAEVEQIVAERGADCLMLIAGVYELLSDALNNEALARLASMNGRDPSTGHKIEED
jgi:hypothetical protein